MALEGCCSYHSPCQNPSPNTINSIGKDKAAESAQRPLSIDDNDSSLATFTLITTHIFTFVISK